MDKTHLRIATRRSQLALTQANWVAERLQRFKPDLEIELLEVVTSGDRIQDRPLRELGGKALFTKEIEQALLDDVADIAVHSLKDLPTELADGLVLVAIPAREDPRDALIADEPIDDLSQLPQGARLGTSSLRRAALLLRARPDIEIVPMRGNVDTRLKRLRDELVCDALVLAEAGLRRLGRDDVERLPLDPLRFVPSPGQGALAVEALSARTDLAWLATALDDRPTRLAVAAERAFLDHLGGSCKVPIGAYARWIGERLHLVGCVADETGDVIQLDDVIDAPSGLGDVERLGVRLAERIRVAGGSTILTQLVGGSTHTKDAYADTAALTHETNTPVGTVYLVGAGPGELGLISVRGKRLLESADAVVYDSLANNDLLSPISLQAERHDVGKRAGDHRMGQAEICQLLVQLAHRHATVVRLKGGDPFIFGRGGEEAAELVQQGIPFEVVPGITSALAAPAFAGVPLTYRGLAQSVAFVTGHGARDPSPEVNWAALAGIDTLVILMGTRRLGANMQALLDAGRSPDDPVLIVEWASFPRQRNLLATVATAAEALEGAGLQAPAVIVVGAVAALHETLNWFSRRPLFGKRILVTRSRSQASRLSMRLYQAGATPVELPSLEIRSVDGDEQRRLDEALLSLDSYDWVVFTSHNGVTHAFDRLRELHLDARALAGVHVAVIGSATADVLRQNGVLADLVPERFDAEGLLVGLEPHVGPGTSVLILRAREARATLTQGLRDGGAFVDDVAAYYSDSPADLADRLAQILETPLDLLTFASTKTVTNLAAAAGDRLEELTRIPAACIGPVTRRAAERLGFRVEVQAFPFTLDALLEAIAEWSALKESANG